MNSTEKQAAMKKLLCYMGFAARARKLASGYNTCVFTMEKRKVFLLIIAEDLADNSKKKIISAAERTKTKYRVFGKMTGNEGKGIFALTDKNFADVISKEIDYIQALEREVF